MASFFVAPRKQVKFADSSTDNSLESLIDFADAMRRLGKVPKEPAMRKLTPLLLLIAVGCHACPRFFDCTGSCVGKETIVECPKEKADCPPPRAVKEIAQPEPVCAKPPVVETKQPEPIRIKIPPQKIILQNEAAPHAMMQSQPMMQPQGMVQPQSMVQPQAAMVQPQMMMVPTSAMTSSPVGAARPGLTFDFIRIPIPFPRLIAVPTQPQMQAVAVAPQAMVMPQAMVAPQAAMVMPQAAMVQPQAMIPVQPQAAMVQPQAMVMPQAAMVPVQPQAAMVQPQAMIPVQPQAAMVPVQPQAAMVHVQPQAAVVQPQAMVPVQPQAAVVQPQAMIPVQPQAQGISLREAEEFCRMVQEMKRRMDQHRLQDVPPSR